MSCSHKKRRVVIQWDVSRKQPAEITQDTYALLYCPSCNRIAIQTRNKFCLSMGQFHGRVTLRPA